MTSQECKNRDETISPLITFQLLYSVNYLMRINFLVAECSPD
jgi:hypothetical protein